MGPSVYPVGVDGDDKFVGRAGLCGRIGDGVREAGGAEVVLIGVGFWKWEVTGEDATGEGTWRLVSSMDFRCGSPWSLRASWVCPRASEISFAAISFTSKVKSNARPAGLLMLLWGLASGCMNSELKDGALEVGRSEDGELEDGELDDAIGAVIAGITVDTIGETVIGGVETELAELGVLGLEALEFKLEQGRLGLVA